MWFVVRASVVLTLPLSDSQAHRSTYLDLSIIWIQSRGAGLAKLHIRQRIYPLFDNYLPDFPCHFEFTISRDIVCTTPGSSIFSFGIVCSVEWMLVLQCFTSGYPHPGCHRYTFRAHQRCRRLSFRCCQVLPKRNLEGSSIINIENEMSWELIA